jgi:hypothetical protein
MSGDDYRRIAIGIFLLGTIPIGAFFVFVGFGRDAARKRRWIRPFAWVYALFVGGFTYAAARSVDAPAPLLALFGGGVAFWVVWTLAVCGACAAVTPRIRLSAAPARCRVCGRNFSQVPGDRAA